MASAIHIASGGVRIHLLSATLMLFGLQASAQDTQPAGKDSVVKIETVKVVSTREPKVAPMQSLTLPATASITAQKVQQTVNLVDPEDAVKYLPSVFLRKRNNGDTQATMATRVWGVSSSARSLIFADGVPITALVANNNTIGGPRWGLVSPIEIARVDMMYGPFSAAYAGNSMGAVMAITTRLPDKLEGDLSQTHSFQTFDLYGTRRTFATSQSGGDVGNRFGKFSFWLSGNYQDSHSQPLAYVTSSSFPAGTSGGFAEQNKLGATANILGANGLLHTRMTNLKAKAAFDITPAIRAAYTFGYWNNNATSGVHSYIEKSGSPTFAAQPAFASGFYDLDESHSSHSLSVRSDTKGDWDFETVATLYRFDKDQQRFPLSSSATDVTFGTSGRAAVLDGTGWNTLDLNGAWHRGGRQAAHTITFGAHQDQYHLLNSTYNTADWKFGPFTTVASEGDGKTRTRALWAQDAWKMSSELKLTLGGRYEQWRGFDGFNSSGTTQVTQPTVESSKFSPKAILSWTPKVEWNVTASVAKAYRFATAAELYQLVTTGTTFTSPDPHLKPDNDLAAELRVTRYSDRGQVTASLFQDDVHDAIISQFLPLVPGSATLFSYLSNVDHVRARGVEVALDAHDVFLRNLDFSGSATYLDARTLALSGRASSTAPAGSAIGKFLPNIPKWRASFAGTYRPVDRISMTLAGRYSSKLYTTLDNSDVRFNTYQGFSEWFVADARATVRFDPNWSGSIGVDNLLNRKYFLFHPFPQRTYVVGVKAGF
jgi:iron complex outermembrane receptor protein